MFISAPNMRTLRRSSIATGALMLLVQVLSVSARTFTIERGESIQDALDQVEPGDTVQLEEGHYWEDLVTKVDGTESNPITIRGKSGTDPDDVVLRGDGYWIMLWIQHDYYIIKGFTINGKALSDADDDNYEDAYRNKLLYILGQREYTTRSGGYKSAVDGVEVSGMTIKNGGAECLRLRYFVTNSKIHDNTIENCGVYDFQFDDGGKTGEGIYIGTSNNQWSDSIMPTSGVDVCSNNYIYDNYIKTKANEGVDVKEGTVDTVIENNEVYMQRDEDAAGIVCRGNRCLIRDNLIEDAHGCGIRLGGARVNGEQYGIDSNVYRNEIVDCEFCGIKIIEEEQGVICENDITPPSGVSDEDYDFVRGDGADEYPDVMGTCSSYPGPPSPSPSPSPDPSPSPNPNPSPSTNPSPSPPTPSGTIGCYKDEEDGRTMTFNFKNSDMTNELCALSCKASDKLYSGTQYSSECWCSSSSSYDDNGSGNCDMRCSGDSGEYCGGFFSMTVSRTEDYDDSPSPTPSGTLGCYQDKSSDRIMDLKLQSNIMTNALCALNCKRLDKKYSGTQYGRECWCSNSDDFTDHGRSSSCNIECPGNDDEYCGGYFAMTVSETDDFDYDDDKLGGYDYPDGYLGCFKDKESQRILDEEQWLYSDDMDVDKCIDYCDDKGEDYAGLQYGRECWCGSDDEYDRHGHATNCDMECNGDDDNICGGNFAVSVYSIE